MDSYFIINSFFAYLTYTLALFKKEEIFRWKTLFSFIIFMTADLIVQYSFFYYIRLPDNIRVPIYIFIQAFYYHYTLHMYLSTSVAGALIIRSFGWVSMMFDAMYRGYVGIQLNLHGLNAFIYKWFNQLLLILFICFLRYYLIRRRNEKLENPKILIGIFTLLCVYMRQFFFLFMEGKSSGYKPNGPAICSLFLLLFILYVFDGNIKFTNLKEKESEANRTIETYRQQLDAIKNSQQDYIRLKHDTIHTLLKIQKTMPNEPDTKNIIRESLNKLINDKNDENQTMKQLIHTIIESHPEISFDIQNNTDELTMINESDLNTLILNIINKRISNITEYQEPKTIQIKAIRQGNMICIYSDGYVKMPHSDNTIEDYVIQQIVKKYNGEIQYGIHTENDFGILLNDTESTKT